MAIPLWSLTPLFIVLIGPMPALFMMGFRFFISGVILSFAAFVRGEGFYSQFRQPAGVWILSIFGILISQMMYVFAMQNAPTAEANFMYCLWPVYVIILTGLYGKEPLGFRQIAATLLGFGGFAVLVDSGGWNADHMTGYLFALFSGLLWGFYSTGMRLFYSDRPASVQGGPFLLYAIVCFLSYQVFGTEPVLITAHNWPDLLAFGIIPVAYVFWEHGIKRGQMQLLALASYFIPLLSAIWISIATDKPWTWPLVIGGALIVLAPMIGKPRKIESAELP